MYRIRCSRNFLGLPASDPVFLYGSNQIFQTVLRLLNVLLSLKTVKNVLVPYLQATTSYKQKIRNSLDFFDFESH